MTQTRTIGLLIGLAVGAACNLFGDEGDECRPLGPTVPEDLWTLPWVEIQVPQGFCGVAAAYQYQVYAFGSVPALAADYDGFDGELTFPPGTRVLVELSSGGAEVVLGAESGEVCGRHWNACTSPGDFACQPLTVVASDVFSATRNEVVLRDDGALVHAAGAFWLLQPRGEDGVWRMDPATFEWEQVAAGFPEGVAGGNSFNGGLAIADGAAIHYLINTKSFIFDTATRSWSAGVELGHSAGSYASGVAIGGRLYVAMEGLLGIGGGHFVYDPATRATAGFDATSGDGEALIRQNTIAFARGGAAVFGGGNECDERDLGCWRQDFRIYDPARDRT